MPVTQLKNVVLPAPLGPMRATISPCRMSRSTPSTARRPPKLMHSCRTSRILSMETLARLGRVFEAVEFVAPPDVGDEPLGAEDHHEDHDRAEQQHAVLGEGPQVFGREDQDQ